MDLDTVVNVVMALFAVRYVAWLVRVACEVSRANYEYATVREERV